MCNTLVWSSQSSEGNIVPLHCKNNTFQKCLIRLWNNVFSYESFRWGNTVNFTTIPCNGSTSRTKACVRPLHTAAGYLTGCVRPLPQCMCALHNRNTTNSLIMHTLLTNIAPLICFLSLLLSRRINTLFYCVRDARVNTNVAKERLFLFWSLSSCAYNLFFNLYIINNTSG